MSPRRAACALALAAALVLAPGAAAAADAGAPPADASAELEALHRAIASRREQVAAYEQQQEGLFEALQAVEEAARAVAHGVARAEQEARAARAEVGRVEAKRRRVAQQAAATERALAGRAVALYKAGEAGPLRLVFAEGSLRDRLARVQALQLLLDHDQRLMERHAAEQRELAEAARAAADTAARSDAAARDLAARRAELETERGEKRTLLARVRRDGEREKALLAELEQAARDLEAKLARLGSDSRRPDAGFAALRGALPPPVPGAVLRRFGRVLDEEYRTETFQKGIDFAVRPGEPVIAVADGEVRYADWFRGYGRMLIIDHGGGYFSVLAHLDELQVSVGDAVAAGQVVASAGETGSLTGPRLYFEIRRGSEALDPADWLRLASAR